MRHSCMLPYQSGSHIFFFFWRASCHCAGQSCFFLNNMRYSSGDAHCRQVWLPAQILYRSNAGICAVEMLLSERRTTLSFHTIERTLIYPRYERDKRLGFSVIDFLVGWRTVMKEQDLGVTSSQQWFLVEEKGLSYYHNIAQYVNIEIWTLDYCSTTVLQNSFLANCLICQWLWSGCCWSRDNKASVQDIVTYGSCKGDHCIWRRLWSSDQQTFLKWRYSV